MTIVWGLCGLIIGLIAGASAGIRAMQGEWKPAVLPTEETMSWQAIDALNGVFIAAHKAREHGWSTVIVSMPGSKQHQAVVDIVTDENKRRMLDLAALAIEEEKNQWTQ